MDDPPVWKPRVKMRRKGMTSVSVAKFLPIVSLKNKKAINRYAINCNSAPIDFYLIFFFSSFRKLLLIETNFFLNWINFWNCNIVIPKFRLMDINFIMGADPVIPHFPMNQTSHPKNLTFHNLIVLHHCFSPWPCLPTSLGLLVWWFPIHILNPPTIKTGSFFFFICR